MDGLITWPNILVAALISALILALQHYLPWKLLFGELHATVRYVMGTLALVVPMTVLFAVKGLWMAVFAAWVICAAGGATVFAVYWLDSWLQARVRAEISEREAAKLRPMAHYPSGDGQTAAL